MTQEELIAKAIEHAKRYGIVADKLHNPKVREVTAITFTSKESPGTAEFYLDAEGNLISGRFSGPDFKPKTMGKQFSKRAQKVLALASEESRRLRSGHIGSEHLLLAVLADGDTVGSSTLLSAGLTAESYRSYLAATGSPPQESPNGYSPSMRGVLRDSTRHADSLGHTAIQPEHFALALLDESDGGAIRALRHFRINVADVRKKLITAISNA